jgi:hypothetical protein
VSDSAFCQNDQAIGPHTKVSIAQKLHFRFSPAWSIVFTHIIEKKKIVPAALHFCEIESH